jgi:hypothetical protein
MRAWLLFFLLGSGVAGAADSLWLLCNNNGLALNLYEDLETKKTDLTLILGMHQFTGTLKKEVNLQGKTGRFKGAIVPTTNNNMVAVNGLLIFGKESHPVNALLTCRTLESN